METKESLIDSTLNLPSLPTVLVRLNALLTQRLPSMGEVAALVGEDPGLAARVLQLVNSPLYPFRGKIDSLQRAVAMLGVRELRNLALSAAVVQLFDDTTLPAGAFERFWRHSLCVGLLSRGLAEAAQQRDLDRFFVMGLLHDIGALVIMQQRPDKAAEAFERSATMRKSLIEAEQEVLGFNHAEIGAALLHSWSLPESITTAVGLHHELRPQTDHRLEQGIVYLANLLTDQIPDGIRGAGLHESAVISDWEWINISHRMQENLVAAALERLEATHQILF